MELTGDELPKSTTLYYDPVLDVHHKLPAAAALTTAYYAAPQAAEDSKRLFEAAIASIGFGADPELPLRANRGYASSLILAREWGLTELEDQLSAAIEASYEPTWDDTTGEFTWGMGLDEPHPRGQFNAFLGAAEASGLGMWERLSAAPLDPCPQIVDVDFPAIALSRAEWVGDILHLTVAPLREDPKVTTTFRLVGGEPRVWYLTGIPGASMEARRDGVVVRVPMVHGDLEFAPGSY